MRVKCCSKDKSRVITHSAEGYATVCFRCGLSQRRFVPHGVRTIQETLRHRRELDYYTNQRGKLSLPDDFTRDIPSFGRAWLLKGGVNSFLTEHYGIGWSEKLCRVVIPVWGIDRLDAVQARAVLEDQKPKYLNKEGHSGNSLFWSDDAVMLSEPIGDWCVLTEDILSTIRVGRIQPAVASLGTSINARVVARIMQFHKRVLIWYDDDAAGRRGAIKARKALELQGAEVRTIRTEFDPKTYNNEEIEKIIKEHTND